MFHCFSIQLEIRITNIHIHGTLGAKSLNFQLFIYVKFIATKNILDMVTYHARGPWGTYIHSLGRIILFNMVCFLNLIIERR